MEGKLRSVTYIGEDWPKELVIGAECCRLQYKLAGQIGLYRVTNKAD